MCLAISVSQVQAVSLPVTDSRRKIPKTVGGFGTVFII